MSSPVDKRVPIEIWEKICSYLYPSQLTRLSRVSRTLYNVVASSNVWYYYYDRICLGYDSVYMLRDPLIDCRGSHTRGSKLSMLYVVAASYHLCDNCCRVSRPHGPQKYATMPLAVQEWSKNEGGAMIRLCLDCRRNHFSISPESIPSEVQGSYISKREIKARYFLGPQTIKSIKDRSWSPETPSWDQLQGSAWSVDQAAKYASWYSEREALEKARFFFGGDVGIQAYQDNPHHLIAKSRDKMDAYIELASAYRRTSLTK